MRLAHSRRNGVAHLAKIPMNRFAALALSVWGAFLLASPAHAASPAAPSTVALVGGNVVATDGGPSISNATVLIAGERITQVGPAASTAVPPDAQIISMKGKW